MKGYHLRRSLWRISIFAVIILLIQACAIEMTGKPRETPQFIKRILNKNKTTSNAFGKTKSYAIVTIAAFPYILNVGNDAGTIAGILKSTSKKYAYLKSSKTIFHDTYLSVLNAFAKSNNFRLIPPAEAIETEIYKNTEGDKPVLGVSKLILAPGYKHYKDKNKLAKLAKKLNVDGVIVIYLNYAYRFSGVGISRIVSVRAHYAVAGIRVIAVNQKAQIVWKDEVTVNSDKLGNRHTIGEPVDMKQLESVLPTTTTRATSAILKKLTKKRIAAEG